MNHPVVFVDLHHASLFKSLQILIEDRLGGTLLRPIGKEWFTRNLWENAAIYGNAPETIDQYLAIRDAKPTKMGMKNNVLEELSDYYLVEDDFRNHKAVTYEQFMEMKSDIDLVMASYYGNIVPYHRLAKEINKPACMQMGNAWPVPWEIVNNLLASTSRVNVPQGKNAVFYHQEFDQQVYRYEDPQESNLIRSFVHCLPEHDIYKQDWLDFQELEKMLPEYKFESYGISCREGIVMKQTDLADKMRASKFGIHYKSGGDGFGHSIHGWFSVGRPVIYKGSQYVDKLAGELLEDGKTGFDVEKRGIEGVVGSIRNLALGDYLVMCRQVRDRFDRVVDYEKEAKQVRQFMENLI